MRTFSKPVQKINFIRLILTFGGFIFLIFISELLYNFHRNFEFREKYYIVISSWFGKVDNLDASLSYLEKAAMVRLTQVSENYNPAEFENQLDLPVPTENIQLTKDYLWFLQALDYNSLSSPDNRYWGKTLYLLGLLAYKNNELDLVIPYWQTASLIAPEWSYFHIELANYYISLEHNQRATGVINYCLKFNYAKRHCQEFMDNNLNTNTYEDIGFLEKTIEEI